MAVHNEWWSGIMKNEMLKLHLSRNIHHLIWCGPFSNEAIKDYV